MGAPEDAIREELIGAVLGELSLLRRDVKEMSSLLENTGRKFKDDGELTLLRFSARYEQFLKHFGESSADVLAKAASFDEAREQLLGEIALRQYDEADDRSRNLLRAVLREEAESNDSISRRDVCLWSLASAIGAAALSVGACAALRFFA